MDTKITLQNVFKNFGDKEVLKGISFEVSQGEIIALLGKNGAGKSTLIHLINGIILPNQGKISIYGSGVNEPSTKNRTGIMFQDNIIVDKLTVRESLTYMSSYYQRPLPIDRLINLAQLQTFENHRVSQLSGGQQRRVNLAFALVGDPDIIFLDEPTNSMDSHSRYEFWKMMVSLKVLGKTIFVTSHYLEELEDIASRIMILSQGQIAYDGDLENLRARFARATIQFSSNLNQEILAELPGRMLSQLDGHYKFGVENPNPFLKVLLPMLDDISNLEIQQTSLTSIYNQFESEVSHHES